MTHAVSLGLKINVGDKQELANNGCANFPSYYEANNKKGALPIAGKFSEHAKPLALKVPRMTWYKN